ncbi:hypothetical protein VNO77_30932 [Canavalia gladiata]|uniref:Uncharacterized protein n=1 Tax=Canavalia gladiata TaxID=3824 RepID=A0AAN9KRA1_CANGL
MTPLVIATIDYTRDKSGSLMLHVHRVTDEGQNQSHLALEVSLFENQTLGDPSYINSKDRRSLLVRLAGSIGLPSRRHTSRKNFKMIDSMVTVSERGLFCMPNAAFVIPARGPLYLRETIPWSLAFSKLDTASVGDRSKSNSKPDFEMCDVALPWRNAFPLIIVNVAESPCEILCPVNTYGPNSLQKVNLKHRISGEAELGNLIELCANVLSIYFTIFDMQEATRNLGHHYRAYKALGSTSMVLNPMVRPYLVHQ